MIYGRYKQSHSHRPCARTHVTWSRGVNLLGTGGTYPPKFGLGCQRLCLQNGM